MNYDITFCAGGRCTKRNECDRFTGSHEPGVLPQFISVAEFAPSDGSICHGCDYFIPKEETIQ